MYSKCFSYLFIAISVVSILLVSGCTQSATPSKDAISAANVTADRVLGSINDGNYADFSKNFSVPMQQGVNQSRFEGLRNDILGQYGKYVSKSGPQALVANGDNVFIYDCQFEKGRLQFQFSINSTDKSTVTGLYYKP
jgi:outer membrane lipoprotein-sorting protein